MPSQCALAGEVRSAVTALHAAYLAAPLPLELGDVGELRVERAQVITQFDDYVLPRLARLDAPMLVVVGGPTGVGKSTLVNSLVGSRVTTPGALRPTTRSPVLVHHPADRDWFGPGGLLPTLERVDRPTSTQEAIQLVAAPTVPRGLAILDAPDFDSVDDGNRALALRLLAAADLWLFVTSAARYSDLVPWQQLSLAVERDLPVAVVMNRIPPEDLPTVSAHLTGMLSSTVGEERLFFVERGPIGEDGRLPGSRVASIRSWLDTTAIEARVRAVGANQAVTGAIHRAAQVASRVADAAELQVEAVSELLSVVDRAYDAATETLRAALGDGSLVRGDLASQWHELLGRDDLPPIADTMSALRERLTGSAPEQIAQIDQLGVALDLALQTFVLDHAERAAESASRALRDTVHGSALLDWSTEDLSRPSRRLGTRARRAISSWRRELVAVVAEQIEDAGTAGGIGGPRSRGLAIALVLQAASTGAGIARRADPAEPQRARRLVTEAGEGVTRMLVAILAEERDRYLQPVLGWSLVPDAPDRLRAAATGVQRALRLQAAEGVRA
ncbi:MULTISPECIES: GTPase [Nocardioides]|uniref:GTPase n=1 Tax=Nocardioides vastitatis TaxID=2568655 RepID=A0ABW0ZGV7_9ACTN|nr:GTPase [Nocardioides sp.]